PAATLPASGVIAIVFPEVSLPFVPRFFTNAIAAAADGESARRNVSATAAAASGRATMRRSRVDLTGVALLIRFSWHWSFVLAWEKAMGLPTQHLPPPGRSMSPRGVMRRQPRGRTASAVPTTRQQNSHVMICRSARSDGSEGGADRALRRPLCDWRSHGGARPLYSGQPASATP